MNKILFFAPFLCSLFHFQSYNDDDNPKTQKFAVGDFYQGDSIFLLNNSDDHGLICAIKDQSFNKE